MGFISSQVVRWFQKEKRDLPWRHTADPYKIWISEIMCQQTGVKTVIPYYEKFLKTYPSLKELAEADDEALLRLWEGLGYYSRAKNLKKAARILVNEFDSKFPDTREELLKLPGVGPYSAGAILSIAFRKSEPALDGNLIRVYSRFFGIKEAVDEPNTLKKLWQIAREEIAEQKESRRDFTEGMMELGAVICRQRQPLCSLCPLVKKCVAYKNSLQNEIPWKAKKQKRIKLMEKVYWMKKNDRVAILPKGHDPKYPHFHRLPFKPIMKLPKYYDRREKYSITVRDIEVFISLRPCKQPEILWIRGEELESLSFPAVDRRIIRFYYSQAALQSA